MRDGWIEAISCSKKEKAAKSKERQGNREGEAAFRMNFLNPHV